MALLLYRLGRFSFRHKWWVIGGWIAVFVLVAGLVTGLNPKWSTDFDLPGTDGGKAMSVMKNDFPAFNKEQEQANTSILVAADDGLQAHTQTIDALAAKAKTLKDVDNADQIVNPLTMTGTPAQAEFLGGKNDQGQFTVGKIQVRQSIKMQDLKKTDADQFKDLLKEFRVGGLQVEGTGSLMQVQDQGSGAESLGFGIAFIVMIIAFGALVAAFIPLITAAVGVGLSMQLVLLLAGVFNMNQSAQFIILMLGIAVSIDYALFIVSRYRSELNVDPDREAAAGRAVGTAGTAVCFAGLTVIIAVAALAVIGIPFVTQMGAGAGLSVLIAVLGALTLIPALLGAFGRFAFSPRIPFLRHGDEPDDQPSNGLRFVRILTTKARYPIAFGALALLVIIAIPMGGMKLGFPSTTDSEYAATNLLAKGFGEGVNGPLIVTLDKNSDPSANLKQAATETVAYINTLPNVVKTAPIVPIGNGQVPADLASPGTTAAIIQITPEQSASSTATHDLMVSVRDHASTAQAAGVSLHVGGQTAITSDMSQKLDSALIPYLVLVIGLAFIIMMIVFRSILVPLTATLGFVFSVCATFGATVAIFQNGDWGIIAHPIPVVSFLPIFVIGVVFGLAIDYQVFLVTRMREEYVHGMTAMQAVVTGYKHGARVVASAAVIMISVFLSFMLVPDTISRMMGFTLAAAVFFDAFIIRMIVIPSVIAIMGDAAWWLPKWLDKIIPNVDIEGEAIRKIPLPSQQQDPGPTAHYVPADR